MFDQKEYDRIRYAKIKAEREAQRSPDLAMKLSDTDAAYIAGLIDGEGCIRISYNCVQDRYIPDISISMTSPQVLDWFASVLGTKSFPTQRKEVNPEYRKQMVVKLTGRRAISLCERCLPYFKVKREQALVLIEFRSTYIQQTGPAGKVPPDILAKRAELKERTHQLNGGKNRTWVKPDHF